MILYREPSLVEDGRIVWTEWICEMQSEGIVADAVCPTLQGTDIESIDFSRRGLKIGSVLNEVRLNWWQIFPIGSICFFIS